MGFKLSFTGLPGYDNRLSYPGWSRAYPVPTRFADPRDFFFHVLPSYTGELLFVSPLIYCSMIDAHSAALA
jgi:hypothetical protein